MYKKSSSYLFRLGRPNPVLVLQLHPEHLRPGALPPQLGPGLAQSGFGCVRAAVGGVNRGGGGGGGIDGILCAERDFF